MEERTVKNRKHRWYYWVLSAAILLAVAMLGAKPAYLNYKSGQLVAQHYSSWEPGADMGARDFDESAGGIEAKEDVMDELTNLFANVGADRDIKMTIHLLEGALRKCNYNYEYEFYKDDIVWYLALAYIRQNQFGDARQMLTYLIEEDSDYAEEAKELYNQIKNMYFM